MIGKIVGESRVIALISSPYLDVGWPFREIHRAAMTAIVLSRCDALTRVGIST